MSKDERLRFVEATVRIEGMPATGRDLALVLDADERAALAAQLGISAVDKFEVQLHAQRLRGGMRVTGRLAATIEQPSVVTLEPVKQAISEPIDRVFLPTGEKRFADAAEADVLVDLDGDDLPDHFEGPEADLSDLIIETLALAIDPYPRGDGESLEAVAPVDDDPPESPFAALQRLKDKGPTG